MTKDNICDKTFYYHGISAFLFFLFLLSLFVCLFLFLFIILFLIWMMMISKTIEATENVMIIYQHNEWRRQRQQQRWRQWPRLRQTEIKTCNYYKSYKFEKYFFSLLIRRTTKKFEYESGLLETSTWPIIGKIKKKFFPIEKV